MNESDGPLVINLEEWLKVYHVPNLVFEAFQLNGITNFEALLGTHPTVLDAILDNVDKSSAKIFRDALKFEQDRFDAHSTGFESSPKHGPVVNPYYLLGEREVSLATETTLNPNELRTQFDSEEATVQHLTELLSRTVNLSNSAVSTLRRSIRDHQLRLTRLSELIVDAEHVQLSPVRQDDKLVRRSRGGHAVVIKDPITISKSQITPATPTHADIIRSQQLAARVNRMQLNTLADADEDFEAATQRAIRNSLSGEKDMVAPFDLPLNPPPLSYIAPKPEWCCAACTFLNPLDALSCSMCDQQRPADALMRVYEPPQPPSLSNSRMEADMRTAIELSMQEAAEVQPLLRADPPEEKSASPYVTAPSSPRIDEPAPLLAAQPPPPPQSVIPLLDLSFPPSPLPSNSSAAGFVGVGAIASVEAEEARQERAEYFYSNAPATPKPSSSVASSQRQSDFSASGLLSGIDWSNVLYNHISTGSYDESSSNATSQLRSHQQSLAEDSRMEWSSRTLYDQFKTFILRNRTVLAELTESLKNDESIDWNQVLYSHSTGGFPAAPAPSMSLGGSRDLDASELKRSPSRASAESSIQVLFVQFKTFIISHGHLRSRSNSELESSYTAGQEGGGFFDLMSVESMMRSEPAPIAAPQSAAAAPPLTHELPPLNIVAQSAASDELQGEEAAIQQLIENSPLVHSFDQHDAPTVDDSIFQVQTAQDSFLTSSTTSGLEVGISVSPLAQALSDPTVASVSDLDSVLAVSVSEDTAPAVSSAPAPVAAVEVQGPTFDSASCEHQVVQAPAESVSACEDDKCTEQCTSYDCVEGATSIAAAAEGEEEEDAEDLQYCSVTAASAVNYSDDEYEMVDEAQLHEEDEEGRGQASPDEKKMRYYQDTGMHSLAHSQREHFETIINRLKLKPSSIKDPER